MTSLYLLRHLLMVLNDKGIVTLYDLQAYDIEKVQKEILEVIHADIGIDVGTKAQ